MHEGGKELGSRAARQPSVMAANSWLRKEGRQAGKCSRDEEINKPAGRPAGRPAGLAAHSLDRF